MEAIRGDLKKVGEAMIETTVESLSAAPTARTTKGTKTTVELPEITFDCVEKGMKIRTATGKVVYEVIEVEVDADGKRTVISQGPTGKTFRETRWAGTYYLIVA